MFLKRRAEFNAVVSKSSALTINRYFRLMLLATVEICCTIPISSYFLYTDTFHLLTPWISWSNIHFNFSRVDLIPAVLWRSNHAQLVAVELSRWVLPLCSILFFALFGFAEEAQRHYRMFYCWIAKKSGTYPLVKRLGLTSYVLLLLPPTRSLKHPRFSPATAMHRALPVRKATHKPLSDLALTTYDIDVEKGLHSPSSPSSATLTAFDDAEKSADNLSFSPSDITLPLIPPPPHEARRRSYEQDILSIAHLPTLDSLEIRRHTLSLNHQLPFSTVIPTPPLHPAVPVLAYHLPLNRQHIA
jgi:hypothetical protein